MIYLDYAATTPLDAEVFAVMQPYFCQNFGNASSQHAFGRRTAEAIMDARDTIARIVGCRADEVYFTSGGTEADNWALKGVCLANAQKGKHLVLSAIEHPALLESAKDLSSQGYEVTLVAPQADGVVRAQDMINAIRPDTIFVSLMMANNEVGTLQPVQEVGAYCQNNGIFFLTDCVQTAGHYPLPYATSSAMSFSAHKFFGPKGVGVLILKRGSAISRFMSGGHQERALRGGTSNTPAIVGCATALQKAMQNCTKDDEFVRSLRDSFVQKVLSTIDGVTLNGNAENRLVNNANLSFDGCDGENILFALDLKGIAVSTGSACSSGAVTPSHVLTAMGYTRAKARSSVRFTFGKYNTAEEVEEVVTALSQIIQKIRNK